MKRRHTRKRARAAATDWIYLTIHGSAYERGFQHGRALYKQLEKVAQYLNEFARPTAAEVEEFCTTYIKPVVIAKYPQIYAEIVGISEGARAAGAAAAAVSVDMILLWNSYSSISSFFPATTAAAAPERCCAFIATGATTTRTGGIVMAHNSHEDFALMQFYCVILRVEPAAGEGHPFKMQTAAGLVASNTDWFITDAGMMGCETTIGNMKYRPQLGRAPFFCRIRTAMQYGRTLDDYIEFMTEDNMGDYACTWLFGDAKTGEIAALELGVHTHHVSRTMDGAFTSANGVDFIVDEITQNEYDNMDTSAGARRARLRELVSRGRGALDARLAKKILADHVDARTGRAVTGGNSYTICKHMENDARRPRPRGAYDGKVTTSEMGGKFWARWGSSCGRTFSMREFARANPQYKYLAGFVPPIHRRAWKIV